MINIIRLIDVVVSIREMYECSERMFLYEWKKSHLSTVISCVIKRDGAYFRWIYDNYKSSVWRLSGDDYRPVRKSQGYILPKRPGPGRFGSSTYSCGIKVGRLAARPTRGGGQGEKKRAEGAMERIPIIHDAGWRAQSGNPGLFEQPRETHDRWFRCLFSYRESS